MKQSQAAGFWRDRVLLIALLGMGILLAGLSVARYEAYNAGMLDLGNMAQAIWSVTQGQPLVFTYIDGPISRLAFHVELLYLAFVPFYALWPDPRLLLIGQALLFAIGAVPAYQLALRRLESRFAARCVALAYLFYPVAHTAVLFDFHGDTLALPLLMFMLDSLDRRAWGWYWLFLGLSLAAKFYVAAPVAVLGLVIWMVYGERRVAVWTSLIGVVYGALAFLVIRPLFTTETTSEAHRGLSYISYYFGKFHDLIATLDIRLVMAAIVFGPAMFVAWRGWRWFLPALPLAAAALLSTGPGGSYDYRYHHYAVVTPFVIMALIHGAIHLRARNERGERRRRNWQADLAFSTMLVLICSILLVDTPLNPLFWSGKPGRGLSDTAYGWTERDHVKDRFLARYVPPDASTAASFSMAPHIVNRSTLYLTRYAEDPGAEIFQRHLPRVDVVVTDALFDYYVPLSEDRFAGGPAYEQEAINLVMRHDEFGLTAARDGLLVFERDPGARALAQEIAPVETPSPDQKARFRFGAAPELLEYNLEQIGPRRFRVSFLWRKSTPVDDTLVAVSRLANVAQMRIVHLPSYALQPVASWPVGTAMRERFEIELPAELPSGTYDWQLGWYTTAHPRAAWDARTGLVADSQIATIARIEIPGYESYQQ